MDKDKLVKKLTTFRETFTPYSDPYDLITTTIILLNEQENEIQRLKKIQYGTNQSNEPLKRQERLQEPDMKTFHEIGYMQLAILRKKGLK